MIAPDHACMLPVGRKGLFEVLDSRHPTKPADDAWMGNMLVNPAKGKAHAAGPEERMGRKDLFALMQQRILSQPSTDAPAGRRVRATVTTIAMTATVTVIMALPLIIKFTLALALALALKFGLALLVRMTTMNTGMLAPAKH